MKAEEKEFRRFYSDFRNDIYRKASEEEVPLEDSFTDTVLLNFEDTEIIEGYFLSPHRKKQLGIKVNAYNFSYTGDERDTLELFVSAYKGHQDITTLPKTEIDAYFKRLQNFLKRCFEGYYVNLEEAQPVYDLAIQLYESRGIIRKIRFFILSDSTVKTEKIPDHEENEITYQYNVWDIKRIYGLISSGIRSEPIEIDFYQDTGKMLPFLCPDDDNPVYTSYQLIMPGDTLVKIYDTYGPRVLERNVRSFLQVRGKVNKGIKDTILENPEMFLAYNNGLSATAEDVTVTEYEGQKCISRIKNFQIVNGAQTTATIHYTCNKFKDEVDLSFLHVPVKLTVLHNTEDLDEFVPEISRCANTQNKIDAADFSSNNPFLVELDSVSKRIRAPAVGGSQMETYWYFERVRGQYDDRRNREGTTPARKKIFDRQYPKTQKFTKPDIAIFEHLYECRPYDVSLGRQKNYIRFLDRIKEKDNILPPDEEYFRDLVAKAVIHRQTYSIVRKELKGSGYWANIVAYTVSLLFSLTGHKINLRKIWNEQDLRPELKDELSELIHEVREVITNPPGGRNVTEWCKKEECWQVLLKSGITLSHDLSDALVSDSTEENERDDYGKYDYILSLPPEIWSVIADWSREKGYLMPEERNTAGIMRTAGRKNRKPSEKELENAVSVIKKAEFNGFDVDRMIRELTPESPDMSEEPDISDEVNSSLNSQKNPSPEFTDTEKAILFILHNNRGSASLKTVSYELQYMSHNDESGMFKGIPVSVREIKKEFLRGKLDLIRKGFIEKKMTAGKLSLSKDGKEYCQSQAEEGDSVSGTA
ncbi:AIPR family protein [Methanoplanus endosymbiosus]|uniref:AIPR family protein n=1 Tax=Methanoplanus endosymbiosus TaxID=33865 RepID=A0A9E7PMW2_9EURY|nr:AIPR family protein [Methanoplanus endosymbiosus]UUX93185.1 AIPR family protein [Methanoplanus endosymbiosus]